MRFSGLQKGVLSLYRQCLREIQKKPAVCIYCSLLTFYLTRLRTYEKISRVMQGKVDRAMQDVNQASLE